MSQLADAGIAWVIIGELTPVKQATAPKLAWVTEIIAAADKAGVPVFIKKPLATHIGIQRKEWPKV